MRNTDTRTINNAAEMRTVTPIVMPTINPIDKGAGTDETIELTCCT